MIYPKTQESFFTILNKICLFFNVKLAVRNRAQINKSYYVIRVENQKSNQILIYYLK